MESQQHHVFDGLLSSHDIPTKYEAGRDVRVESLGARSSNSSTYKPQTSSALSPALKAWSWDLASCVLAIIALAAIIITLAVHKDDSLPSWPLGITVNALISVFAVLFKCALLVPVAGALSQLKWSWFRESRPLMDLVDFDNASRGNIWSSAVLIIKTKAIKIPALGGLIMIAAIAVDPFIQQVVRYEPCPQPLEGAIATVARTNNYTATGFHTGAMQQSLDAPMQAAIYTGVYQSWSPVSPTCTTGNCTFPDFRSVGMCGQCEDVTSEILYTPHGANSSIDAWSLPSGLWIGGGNPYVLNMSSSMPDALTPMLTSEVIAITNYTAYGAFGPASYVPTNQTTPLTPWRPKGINFITAARCSLRPCVYTNHVNVTANKLVETTNSTVEMTQLTGYEGQPEYAWLATPMPCLVNGSYYEASSFTQSNVTNATNQFPVQGLLPDNQTAWLPDECVFVYADTLGLVQYLESYLTGWELFAPEAEEGNPAFISQLWKDEDAYSTGSSFSLINSTWASLAGSMTAHIRQAGDAVNSAPATGQTLHMNTCLRVRWAWLSYPVVILFLTIILIMATATGSFGRSTTHQLWRDSPLALLFHGLDDRARRKARDVERKKDMEQIARGIYAKISDEGDGPLFQCADRQRP